MYKVYKTKSEKFRWRLTAENGEVLASGQAFTTKAKCLKSIELVKASGDAEIVDETVVKKKPKK